MKHRNSHLLIGYWSRMRRGRNVPDQSDIDPRAIKRMLAHIFILEAKDPSRPVYRLAGTNLCDRFGQELRWTSFLSLWEPRARETLALLLGQSLAANAPVCLSGIGETARCTLMEMETVMAPLTFGSGAPQRFLGISQFLGDASQLEGPIVLQRLKASNMIREEEPAHNDVEPPPAPPAFTNGDRPGRAPYLRLVVSRETPTLHCDLDETARGALKILDSSPVPGLVG